MVLFILAVISAESDFGGIFLPLLLVVLGGFAMLIPVVHRDSTRVKTLTEELTDAEEENLFA